MTLDSATEYALSFSGEAVHLQTRHKPAPGDDARPVWRPLGSVEFDDENFHETLIELRQLATGAGPEAVLQVTLVIPDDQILYTTLTVAPSADREFAVGRALDGLTPYQIEDLAFDWDGDGDSVRVAAAARQTLREAREFAAQYGFQGVSYCAIPQDDQFPGEPIFVLDMPARAQPQIDRTAAGVTAAALMIQDEPGAEALAVHQDPVPQADDASDAAEDYIAHDFELPADAPATRDPAPLPVPEDAAPVATAPVQNFAESAAAFAKPANAMPEQAALDLTAREQASTDQADAELATLDQTSAAQVDPQTDPTQPEPAAADLTLQDDPATPVADGAGAVRKAPPVVRHAPARPDTQRPTPPGPMAAQRGPAMNPRARAVHDRAAEARQTRQAEAEADSAAPTAPVPSHRRGLSSLTVMLIALAVGLGLIWSFVIPEAEPAQMVAANEPAQTRAETPAESSAQSSAATAADPASAPDAAATAAAQAPSVEQATPAPATTAAAEIPELDDPEAPMPQVRAEPPISALTETEQRRVIIAAAAVAAAVVPPPGAAQAAEAATTPAPAATRQAAQPTATRPALTRPALTQPAAPAANPTPRAATTPRQTAAAPRAARAATAAPTAVARTTPRLTSSARPQLAPRRSTPQTTTPRADAAPRLPSDPLPYATSQVQPPRSSARPPSRARAQAAQATPATRTATDAAPTATPAVTRQAPRPPLRPEGSAPDLIDDEAAPLEPSEQAQLQALMRDLNRHGLALPAARSRDKHDIGAQLAQSRPQRKPGGGGTASDAVSASAVEAALQSATSSPPDRPAGSQAATAAPARDSGGLLRGSSRPASRPSSGRAAPVSESAVESAIAAAVDASTATPGGVQLSALRSSPLPPRRSDSAPAARSAAPDAAAGAAPAAAAAAAAATPSASEAEIAARRALDEQLQAQAEARIRARAQADAAVEAQARAQAEARARAQAAAEERAARASRQTYKAPEVDDEPEVAANTGRGGTTAANVAKSATQPRGIDLGRTTIIGIIGAGKASRALIRLRNGKIVTVRLGDRIDGGTINSIGDGRLTYVKSGQVRELRMLDGR